MPRTKGKKKTVNIRIDEQSYRRLRKLAFDCDMKIIEFMHEVFVAQLPETTARRPRNE